MNIFGQFGSINRMEKQVQYMKVRMTMMIDTGRCSTLIWPAALWPMGYTSDHRGANTSTDNRHETAQEKFEEWCRHWHRDVRENSLASNRTVPNSRRVLLRDVSWSSHTMDYPARRLALKGQCWIWLGRCQYTVTGWDGKFDLWLLSQCGSM